MASVPSRTERETMTYRTTVRRARFGVEPDIARTVWGCKSSVHIGFTCCDGKTYHVHPKHVHRVPVPGQNVAKLIQHAKEVVGHD